MNKDHIEQILTPEWFDPTNPEDRLVIMTILQELGRYVEQAVLIEVWTSWNGENL